ncbi:type II toxin-antitoxin system HicB family antitoxin [Promineifilum sp.]|uniref:type II toxin-antitoxin system HicB family antitoxin n=1 Tax=Promineifilum sp. TaxID=2664178 RepID=UPI0035B1665F
MRYPVVIHKDPDSDYGVTVPDLPGCFSAGSTIDEALSEVAEAIEAHIEGMLLDGEEIPAAGSIESHQSNPDYQEGIWAFVTVDLSKLSGKTRRVNISVPERLLSLMDQYAAQRGETRSGLITRATLEYIAAHAES